MPELVKSKRSGASFSTPNYGQGPHAQCATSNACTARLSAANEFAPHRLCRIGLVDTPRLTQNLHHLQATAGGRLIGKPSHRCVRERPTVSDRNSNVRSIMRNAQYKRRARVNDCVRGELADHLRDRPCVVRRAAGLEHGVRKMARLRNAARAAIELDVGFLHTTDPPRDHCLALSYGCTFGPFRCINVGYE